VTISCSLSYLALISGSVCGVLALLELILKYPHALSATILVWNPATALYLSFNFVVGCVVYLAATSPDMQPYVPAFLVDGTFKSEELRAFLVGFLAIAFLRASIFSVKVGDMDVPVGPAAILQGLQSYLDRRIDIAHKKEADKKIAEIMNGFDALSGKSDLMVLCLDGLNSCSKEEMDTFRCLADDAMKVPVTLERTRAIALGTAIYRACGLEVLQSSVDQLRENFPLDENGKSLSQVSIQLIEERNRLLKESKK
jgi:hypothetical protein